MCVCVRVLCRLIWVLQSPTCHRGGLRSIPGQSVYDMRWTEGSGTSPPQSLSFHQCPIPTSILILRLSNNKRGSPGTLKQSTSLAYVGGGLDWEVLPHCFDSRSGETCFCGISGRIGLENAWTLFAVLLTPWSRVLLEKLTGFQLVKFPAFYRTRGFITALTSDRHLPLS